MMAKAHKVKPPIIAESKVIEENISVSTPKLLLKCVSNNIFVVISTENGRLLESFSCGVLGFKNTSKVSEKSAIAMIDEVKKRLNHYGAESVKLELRGFNPMRNTLIYQLRKCGLSIGEIIDTTGIPFNGCRPKKARRL